MSGYWELFYPSSPNELNHFRIICLSEDLSHSAAEKTRIWWRNLIPTPWTSQSSALTTIEQKYEIFVVFCAVSSSGCRGNGTREFPQWENNTELWNKSMWDVKPPWCPDTTRASQVLPFQCKMSNKSREKSSKGCFEGVSMVTLGISTRSPPGSLWFTMIPTERALWSNRIIIFLYRKYIYRAGSAHWKFPIHQPSSWCGLKMNLEVIFKKLTTTWAPETGKKKINQPMWIINDGYSCRDSHSLGRFSYLPTSIAKWKFPK